MFVFHIAYNVKLAFDVYFAPGLYATVVAFDVGGTSDIVKHKINGYLAKPYEIDDMVCGIEFCSENQIELSKNCPDIRKKFDNEKIMEEYLKVYESVV